MKMKELTDALAEVHNMISNVTVSGDNAILIGDSLRAMRGIVKALLTEGVENEKEEEKR